MREWSGESTVPWGTPEHPQLGCLFPIFLHFYLFYFAKPLNNKMFASIKKGFNWYYKFKGPLKNVVSQENIVMHAKKNLS